MYLVISKICLFVSQLKDFRVQVKITLVDVVIENFANPINENAKDSGLIENVQNTVEFSRKMSGLKDSVCLTLIYMH